MPITLHALTSDSAGGISPFAQGASPACGIGRELCACGRFRLERNRGQRTNDRCKPARALKGRLPLQPRTPLQRVCQPIQLSIPADLAKDTDRGPRTTLLSACATWPDIHYPDTRRIRVVTDNISTHTAGALYEIFAALAAHRLLEVWSSTTRLTRKLAQYGRFGERERGPLIVEVNARKKQRNASGA